MTGSIFGVNNECRLQTLFLSVPLTQVIYLLNTSAPVSGDGQYSYSFPQLPPWPLNRPLMTLSWRERRCCRSTDLACLCQQYITEVVWDHHYWSHNFNLSSIWGDFGLWANTKIALHFISFDRSTLNSHWSHSWPRNVPFLSPSSICTSVHPSASHTFPFLLPLFL